MSLTVAELAKMANVSPTTVTFALNDKYRGQISEARRAEIRALAERHGYRLNPAASALARGRTLRVGLVIESALSDYAIIGHHTLFSLTAFLATATHRRHNAIEIAYADPARSPEEIADQLQTVPVDALVLVRWRTCPAEAVLAAMAERGVPTGAVSLDDADPTIPGLWGDIDIPGTFEAATRRLTREGHTDIVYVDPMRTPCSEMRKVTSFQRVLREDLGREDLSRVYMGDGLTFDSMSRVCRAAVAEHPEATAFLLGDSWISEPLFQELARAGRVPGRDARVVGFGQPIWPQEPGRVLSYYSRRLREQAEHVVKELLDWVEAPEEHEPTHGLIPPLYVAGDT